MLFLSNVTDDNPDLVALRERRDRNGNEQLSEQWVNMVRNVHKSIQEDGEYRCHTWWFCNNRR